MENFKFIDSHAHLHSDYDSRELDKAVESSCLAQAWLLALECYDASYGFAGNKEVLDVAKRYKGFFIPFGFIDFAKGPDQIDRMKEAGFVGLKAIRPIENYDSLKYYPIYGRAQELKMPILFHVGIISRKPQRDLTNPEFSTGPTRMAPAMLDNIAAAFPDLKLLQGHMGVPWCNELFESLWYYPNINASVSGLIDYKWLIDNLDRCTETGVRFVKKMMFAVDDRYGIKGSLERIEDNARFFRMFFQNVGMTYAWGRNVEDYLFNNAHNFIKEFI
jgi:predicted TIM-barrel fold metal-dependent hydrolase